MSKRSSRRKRNQGQKEEGHPTLFEAKPSEGKEAQKAYSSDGKTESNEEAMRPFIRKVYAKVFENKAAAWTALFTCALVVFSGLLWKVASDGNDTSVQKDHSDATGEINFDTPPCPIHNCYDENCSDYHAKVQQLADALHTP